MAYAKTVLQMLLILLLLFAVVPVSQACLLQERAKGIFTTHTLHITHT